MWRNVGYKEIKGRQYNLIFQVNKRKGKESQNGC